MNVYKVCFYCQTISQPKVITVQAVNLRSASRKAKNRLALNLNLSRENRPSLLWMSTELVAEQLKFGGGGRHNGSPRRRTRRPICLTGQPGPSR